jgi:hypothetical protein
MIAAVIVTNVMIAEQAASGGTVAGRLPRTPDTHSPGCIIMH